MLVKIVGKLVSALLFSMPIVFPNHSRGDISAYLQAISMQYLKFYTVQTPCLFVRCVIFTRLARSMLSLKGKNASELTATACRELIQFFFSVCDRISGTSSYMDFHTARSGPYQHNIHGFIFKVL